MVMHEELRAGVSLKKKILLKPYYTFNWSTWETKHCTDKKQSLSYKKAVGAIINLFSMVYVFRQPCKIYPALNHTANTAAEFW